MVSPLVRCWKQKQMVYVVCEGDARGWEFKPEWSCCEQHSKAAITWIKGQVWGTIDTWDHPDVGDFV